MSRLSVSIVSAVAVLIASVGGAFAATSPEIEPAAAAAGDEVMFFNGCFEVVDEPPSEVQVALTQAHEQPDDESAGTLAMLVDRFTYSFLVPEVQPGDYWVSLECAPGDWRTNLSEPGGAAALTVCEGNCVEGGLDILVYKYIDPYTATSTPSRIKSTVRAGSSGSTSRTGLSRMRPRGPTCTALPTGSSAPVQKARRPGWSSFLMRASNSSAPPASRRSTHSQNQSSLPSSSTETASLSRSTTRICPTSYAA